MQVRGQGQLLLSWQHACMLCELAPAHGRRLQGGSGLMPALHRMVCIASGPSHAQHA